MIEFPEKEETGKETIYHFKKHVISFPDGILPNIGRKEAALLNHAIQLANALFVAEAFRSKFLTTHNNENDFTPAAQVPVSCSFFHGKDSAKNLEQCVRNILNNSKLFWEVRTLDRYGHYRTKQSSGGNILSFFSLIKSEGKTFCVLTFHKNFLFAPEDLYEQQVRNIVLLKIKHIAKSS